MKVGALVAAAVLAAALVVVTVALAGRPAASAPESTSAAKLTVVGVTITDKGFKLSKRSVPTGTVVFRIVNKGKLKHAFRAGGKRTPLIAPGKRATLTVRFLKPGKVALACAVKAHAARGMVGRLTVVKAAAPPRTTVVTVSMYEMGFKLSKSVVGPGTVVFEVVNDGKLVHDFRIRGQGTPLMKAGEKAKLTVQFPQAGRFSFVCTVEGHAAAGMVGKLTVGSG